MAERQDQREEARLGALRQLNLLDTPPSESFDRITRMASQVFGLPIAAVSLTDRDRQWFKSRVGVAHQTLARRQAPCAQVAETGDIVIIPDLLADDGYRTSPLADQGVRFYAGAPLVTRDGFGLGALCVLGTEPRIARDDEIAALTDLAAMVMAQIELQHAFGRIDTISGLPNRMQLFDDLDDLGRGHPDEPRLAVLVDIFRPDQFSTSIRVMGPTFLDEVVQDTVRLLRCAVSPHRTIYHVGPTQFLFLAPREAELAVYLAALKPRMEALRGHVPSRFVIAAVVGIAPFVAGRTQPRDVLRTAFNAAQDAWTSESAVCVYSPDSDELHCRRFHIFQDFSAALEAADQLRVVYQPRICLRTGACVGAEALLRWRHPELGDISPAEFIPIIERTEFARPLTDWILDKGLAQLGRWHRAGMDVGLSINVSAANLEEHDLAARVQLHLLKHRVRPDRLEIEVTESAIMGNERQALAQLHALREAGVQLAIDDFGTGYSSLAYLPRLPAQVVKIDRSFIAALDDGERQRALIRSMIALSQQLDYRVVAEGVETAEAAALLGAMGCEEAQGFLYAQPLEAAAFACWHRDQLPPVTVAAAA